MNHGPDWLLHLIYGVPTPTPRREKPMQVLAVGISRSGTESLREALHILGYEHTHHGFDTILPPYDLENIYRLLKKKYSTPSAPGDTPTTKLTASDFDTVLGNCVGVCDLTAAEFAPELIAAYPDAKVILNTRSDLDAWHKSMQATMGYFDANPVDWDWCKSWFSAELFWVRQAMCRTMMPTFFRGSFASNGKWVYEQHVAMIRGLNLPKERILEWSVEDGWEPLCRFLGKQVPDQPFPNGNPPKAWAERIAATTADYHRRAVRNMALFGAVVVGVAGVAVARGRGSRDYQLPSPPDQPYPEEKYLETQIPSMLPISITTTGYAKVSTLADRAVLHFTIRDCDPDHAAMEDNIKTAKTSVKAALNTHLHQLVSVVISPESQSDLYTSDTKGLYSVDEEISKLEVQKEHSSPSKSPAQKGAFPGTQSIIDWMKWKREIQPYPFTRVVPMHAKEEARHRTSITYKVEFLDISSLGHVTEKLEKKPFVYIDGIQWSLSDSKRERLERDMRILAEESAVAKVKDYARLCERDSVKTVEVVENPVMAGRECADRVYVPRVLQSRQAVDSCMDGNGDRKLSVFSFQPPDMQVESGVTMKFLAE